MKKLFLALACLALAASGAFAQYRTGMRSLGGSVGISAEDPGDANASLAPTLGYSVSDRREVGITAIIAALPESNYQWGLAPFLRGNFAVSDNAGGFAQVAPSVSYTHLSDEVYAWAFGITGQIGGYYFITPKVSVEAALGQLSYNRQSIRFDGDEIDEASNWRLGLFTTGLTISAFYHF